MKKKLTNTDQDLSHMDHREVIFYSRGLSGRTNAEVARDMGLGEETVARYQRAPNPGEHAYDLQLHRIRTWCRAVDNYIVMQWVAQQCGGVFVRVDRACPEDVNITTQISRVNKEAADVVSRLLADLQNGVVDEAEKPALTKELRELLVAVETALMITEKSYHG